MFATTHGIVSLQMYPLEWRGAGCLSMLLGMLTFSRVLFCCFVDEYFPFTVIFFSAAGVGMAFTVRNLTGTVLQVNKNFSFYNNSPSTSLSPFQLETPAIDYLRYNPFRSRRRIWSKNIDYMISYPRNQSLAHFSSKGI